MPNLGGWELMVILAVLVLLFGATKLPTAARSIGQSMRIFKAEMRSSKDEPTTPASQQQSLPPSGPTAAAHESRTEKPEEPRHHNDTIR
jgi:sec-independent protein translocase protein TatA